MKTTRKTVGIGLFGLAALAAALPVPAWAFWGFTAQLYEKTCPATVPLPTLPAIAGFPDRSSCETALAEVQAITQSFQWDSPLGCTTHCSLATCTVGYNTTPCTGTDVAVAGSFAPLQNGVSAINPVGPETGSATFTPHYSQNGPVWQQEADIKAHAYPALDSTAEVPLASARYENRFADLVSSRCSNPNCLAAARGGGVGSSIRSMGPTYSAPEEPERMSDDPSVTGQILPMITIDETKAISVGGAGVHQGPADTPPPPTPVRINRGEHCPNSSWWYNTATKQCYGGGYDDCNKDNSAGKHSCIKR